MRRKVGFLESQCQAVALSHKKKTAGRPPDWPEETNSNAEWERLACNEVIWEEMINADANAMDMYSKEVALDTEKTGKDDTLDIEKDSTALKRVHGERSEGTTGQQRTVYTMATGQNMTTGQQVRVKSMIDSGNTLRYGVAITKEF